jgi:hypothetical protein
MMKKGSCVHCVVRGSQPVACYAKKQDAESFRMLLGGQGTTVSSRCGGRSASLGRAGAARRRRRARAGGR